MCAAKFERTGFMLRNAWPNFKHFANEQSASFAQSANESSSSFARKNSKNAEATAAAGAAAAAGRLTSRQQTPGPATVPIPPSCSQPSSSASASTEAIVPSAPSPQGRPRRVPRVVLDSRRLAAPLLRGDHGRVGPGSAASQAARAFVAQARDEEAAAAAVAASETWGHHPGLLEGNGILVGSRGGDTVSRGHGRAGASIKELVETAAEKYTLNTDFWGKYEDIPSMAKAYEKEDILQIVENFVLIHRKHVYLFQRLKVTVLRTLEHWSAPDLAVLCHAWAQLGFLHEDLCIAMATRVGETAHLCSPQELCWLMDAYATSRCSIQSAADVLTQLTLLRLDDFTMPQLCLHASSFARLNIRNETLFRFIGERFVANGVGKEAPLNARDVTLAAYSFAKLGFFFPGVFETLAGNAADVIRDFTSRDLQMLVVALARAQHRDTELLSSVSAQAQRRIAQFNAESLALTLRAMAFFGVADGALFTRAVCHLPRSISTFRPADVTTLLSAFAAAQVHSMALFDIVTPYILERATVFTPSDWVHALGSYAALGHKDATFLAALGLHLEPSRLSLQQLGDAMADCSRLSFAGASVPLVAAATQASPKGGAGTAALPGDLAAQMYSALLLLGHSLPSCSSSAVGAAARVQGGAAVGSSGDAVVRGFLHSLAETLRTCGAPDALSLNACVNLCFACLVAPPALGEGTARHPFDASALVARCTSEQLALSVEERLLLRHTLAALDLLPWDRYALRGASRLAALFEHDFADSNAPPDGGRQLSPYLFAMMGHLAPQPPRHIPRQGASAGTGHAIASASGGCPSSSSISSSNAQHQPGQQLEAAERLQGACAGFELREALYDMSCALHACGVDHSLRLPDPFSKGLPGPGAHIVVQRRSLLKAAGRPQEELLESAAHDELAVLWGSSLHYVSTDLTALAPAPPVAVPQHAPRLSPAAQLQLATLRASSEGSVGAGRMPPCSAGAFTAIVVPHWWWPRSLEPQARGAALARFLLDGGRPGMHN